ncbi:hypothetical protein BG011_004011 [Mortierella polycephala]|uniref:Uncharacterized protein n=1 Tax=Mortierella polycephala TaxID=41804 RepID=A0A9P6U2Z0_9FUNG|nr:hypothetical protein BG011_004011 [Mortierella polycephala]
MTESSLPQPWTGDDYDCGFPVTLIPELSMVAASNAIREKPNWWQKYKDPTIVERWKREIISISGRRGGGYALNDAQVEYIFKELDWYAQRRQDQVDRGVEAPIEEGIDGIRRADGLVPQELKQRLMACVEKLKDIPDHLKDWHPGSNMQVLDLVHPSLFPLIAGRTLVTDKDALPPMDFIGQGKVLEKAPRSGDVDSQYCSEEYQWLPTDFDVGPEGKVKIKSYINNLHPIEHKEMYPVLEEIFEKFLPMFEEVLADMRGFSRKKPRLRVDAYDWYESPSDDLDDDGYDEYYENRVFKPLIIPEFVPREERQKYELTGKPLQVIVKLANIELTPENPKYKGGTWHVEGMANENIVASGIYYYHTENISESRLNFRIQVSEPDYEQSDDRGCGFMYQLANDEPLVQYLDGVNTNPDRCIAFPNIYQHQVQPFELEDPTKPGSRCILVYFLIDPERPVLSTTRVPPQQKDWALPQGLLQEVARKMPPEIFAQIDKLVDWPIDLEEAKMHREKLMKERKYFVKSMNETVFERPFSLCEH